MYLKLAQLGQFCFNLDIWYNIIMNIVYIITFIFGLIVGSFLNCVTYRLEKGKSFLKGRSFCPKCKHKLSLLDLIPLVSFLFLGGKCRYCHKKISWQYPLVELGTGIVFVLIANLVWPIMTIASIITSLFLIAISCFLIIIFVYDFKYLLILDKVIYPLIVIILLYQTYNHFILGEKILIQAILSGVIASLAFFLVVFFTKGKGMGLGDVKFAIAMGLFLGFPNILVGLFFAFTIGAIIGVGLILARKKGLKSEVPFGPFLVVGTFIGLFWGEAIVHYYLNYFI